MLFVWHPMILKKYEKKTNWGFFLADFNACAKILVLMMISLLLTLLPHFMFCRQYKWKTEMK
jgi:hypothetical protein